MEADGVIGRYAIAGAVAAYNYIEPTLTEDLDILVSFIIIAGLPGSAEWALGLLVGINLVFGGATLIGMALAARKEAQS